MRDCLAGYISWPINSTINYQLSTINLLCEGIPIPTVGYLSHSKYQRRLGRL